jgi:hypothetical protein
MKDQITVRGIDAEASRRVRMLAAREHISINKAAITMIRKGAGLRPDYAGPETVGASLDAFIGSWSREGEEEFLRSIRDMEQVDEAL